MQKRKNENNTFGLVSEDRMIRYEIKLINIRKGVRK